MNLWKQIGKNKHIKKILPYSASEFKFKPRFSHIVRNIGIWQEAQQTDLTNLGLIGIFGLSRGGTNLIGAQLHYQLEFFAVSEREKSLESINTPRMFLVRSIFGHNGLQRKKLAELQYVIFNKMNSQDPLWKEELLRKGKRKYIYYLRNPLRTIISMHNYGEKNSRDEWKFSAFFFETVIDNLINLLKHHQKAKKNAPDKVKLVLHEQFCQYPEKTLEDIVGFIDQTITPKIPISRSDKLKFFSKMYCCNKSPILKDNVLTCPNCQREIRGHGLYNPMNEILFERTIASNLEVFFSVENLNYFRERLGNEIANY